MQFPESWLREFCNPPLTTSQLAELLTMSGMEVEELRPVAPPFSGVVVAAVLAVERHPNADRLSVCQVDDGSGRVLNIVCGAPNVRPGIKVPCARVGARLPPADAAPDAPAVEIKPGRLRGVESQGMLCSARELKLSEDHGGLLLLADEAPVGQDIRDHLGLDDTLFTLKLTPNLGHLLSVHGIAREVSALTGAPLHEPLIEPAPVASGDRLPVRVLSSELCGRFSGRIVRGVDTRVPTPAWMVDRLARCGQRSVSPLVDISNYVMFELGQPTHIFDLDKIRGGLTVRWGEPGETLELLNGNTVTLDDRVGVIADEQAVESLAGIMGGQATAVGDDTRDIYIEAAFWWPESVAGRSRRYNFATDAGHRFERGVDPARTVAVIERITALVQQICGGVAGPVDDQTLALPKRPPVPLRVARAAKVIGMPLSAAQCRGVMDRLGLAYTAEPRPEGDETIWVTPPSWRFDLLIEEDLIEEVIRVLGFGELPATPPVASLVPRVRSERSRSVHALRRAVADRGYVETINFSFVEARWEHELAGNADPIKVLNPIASPLAVMRSSLMGSLLQVLRTNLAHRAPRVRVFELGRVFSRDTRVVDGPTEVAGVRQTLRLGGLAHGHANAEQWGERGRAVDFFDVKGDLEAWLLPRVARFLAAEHPALHPGRSARIELEGQPIGFVGELHPRWRQAYELPTAPILFEVDLSSLLAAVLPVFQPLPRQQSIRRDLALVTPESISHDQLLDALRAAPTPLLKSVHLFDVYKPGTAGADLAPGERSMAVHLELRDDDATLTEERIDAALAQVLAHVQSRLGVRLRS